MESINQFLADDEKISLNEGESLLWKKITTKKKGKKLDKFFILTDKRWIQKINVSYDAYVYLLTVVDVQNYIFDIKLKDIKYIFTQKFPKEQEFVGFILNEKIEKRNDEYLLIYGVDLTPEEYPEFMEVFNKLVKYSIVQDKEGKYDSYKLFKCEP